MRALAILAFVGCASSPTVERASLDNLEFMIPTGWTSHDLSNQQRKMVEWTPPDDEAKQSVMLIRTDSREAMAKAGTGRISRVLEQAQANLPAGKFTRPTQFTTRSGFHGVRVEGEFVPPGTKTVYRRMHAVVVVESSLLHVVYTAREADRDVFEVVVDSLARRGA